MRKLIILISITVFSCSQKRNEIDRIEIMSYYYNLHDSQTEFKTEPVTCSIIDENGNVETIQKTPFPRPLRYARTLAQNCILCTQRASTIKNLESKKFNWRLFHLTTSGSSATSIYLNIKKNRSVCNPATGNELFF